MARSLAAGNTPTGIAKRYGYKEAWVSRIINSPLFQAELSRLQDRMEDSLIDQEIKDLMPRSVEIIAEELYADAPTARRTESAFKLLDRTGYHPKSEKALVDNRKFTFVNLTPSPGEDPDEVIARIALIKQTLAPKEDAEVIDI